jgi:hypothetical protein
MRLLLLFASLVLTACATAPGGQVSMNTVENRATELVLPSMHSFAGGPALGLRRANADMAQDFLDLEFKMESGRDLPVFTRFESPITVALIGQVPGIAPMELSRLIKRIRSEADVNIRLADGADLAQVTIDFQPKSQLHRAVPTAACFTLPNVRSFAEYRANRRQPIVDWSRVTTRRHSAIIIPADVSPQEVRDCLHEELAQAIGPLNDLYRLPDSVFNDDNFHSVLTGFDMLMLRAHYAPELHSGMTRAEVAARLPALLARLNPDGERIARQPLALAPRTWIASVPEAFSGSATARLTAANRMLAIAKAQGWRDNRLGFSYFALARAQAALNPNAALVAYETAAQIWRTLPGAAINIAHVDMQLAAFSLSARHFDQALALTGRAIPVAQQHQNAALLATMLAIRAAAFDGLGRRQEAQSARLDSLGWARYAFGSEALVRARLADIAALASRGAFGG